MRWIRGSGHNDGRLVLSCAWIGPSKIHVPGRRSGARSDMNWIEFFNELEAIRVRVVRQEAFAVFLVE